MNNPKYSIMDMQNIAQQRQGECLSFEYVDSLTKLVWKCKQAHEWSSAPRNILEGKWCPVCAVERAREKLRAFSRKMGRKWTIQDMKSYALSRNGECLSEEFISSRTRLTWRCRRGHSWESDYHLLLRKQWCPRCSRRLREKICRAIFRKIFNESFPKTKPPWLMTSDGDKLELDGYSEKLKIAFEHNGIQHYKRIDFFEQRQSLEQRREHDLIKNQLCLKNNVILITISYTVPTKAIEEYIITELKRKGVNLPNLIPKRNNIPEINTSYFDSGLIPL